MTALLNLVLTEAGNILPACLCIAALTGLDARICLVLTLWVHVALILI